MTVDDLIGRVYAAPRGPEIVACFDYDGTVISGDSVDAFAHQRFRDRELGPVDLARMAWAGLRGVSTEREFAEQVELSLGGWRGRTEQELTALGESLFKHEIAAQLHSEVWELVAAHHAMGHTVVLASSGTRFQAGPMARELGAHHLLCTEVEVEDGRLTGRVRDRPVWGLAKARALRRLAAERGLDLTRSFAYADGDEDVMFLESVGNPVVVEPEERLAEEAVRRGWPVLRCVPRGGWPGALEMARTVGFYGAFAGALGAGLGVGLLRRSRRAIVDVAGSVGSDVGLELAGVHVEVLEGAEHLAHRPAIFIFNHQSKIDPFIGMKLLRGGFTGVAKKEARNVPGFGLMFQLADVAFVDRGNTAQARTALEPTIAKMRNDRMSLLMAPEGTRSATPRLGRFKAGAFHIAMQAGVPIVPIVIRNAGEVMWRGAQTIRSGTVQVRVLPPVDTEGWQPRTVRRHADEVRDMYVRTLATWPGRPVPPSAEDDPAEAGTEEDEG
ncbi:MAG TPA: HAD-IB family hydrolase [Pseudonocardia sp.]|jgi:putative phosphoserine phosphatase/1-acylglycerol-3-phosphate O-acyltransferase